MKRSLLVLFSLILMLTASCQKEITPEDKGIFKVTPTELSFSAKKGHQDISVKTSSKPWKIVMSDNSEWVKPERMSGRFSSTLSIYVDKNSTGADRTASFAVESEGFDPITVIVKQGATNVNPNPHPVEDVFPDKASGITVEPKKPDADGPCTIHFRPTAESPLYKSKDEIYVHIGLYADEVWQFVPADWDENIEKCHMTKVEENHWTLELGPTIREYFGSGETPVVKIAMVIRNDQGVKGYDYDQYNSCIDNKYTYVPFMPDDVVFEKMPAGVKTGINYNADKSVTFVLYDKAKDGKVFDYCYLIGEFSKWERQSKYMMKRDASANCWWYTMPASEIEPGKEYLFQYHVGDAKQHFRLTDPYTEVVYDPWNDQWISNSTYPDMTPYPEGTRDIVAAFQVDRPQYSWKNGDYEIEDCNDLVIYEMLLRDFTSTKDLNGALGKLDYIDKLGVNAIELMPIQEFDGNDSWGYNPNHYCALDKAYGTRDMYKKFIDECHGRGIAVIVDVVYNHATGLHPMARIYWGNNETLPNNPWFNVTAPHQFSVFQDWNHTEPMTKEHIKRTLEYMIKEYKVDGFRFDLSKGFTQNSGTEGVYDAQRVGILKEYNSFIKSVDPNAVVILEHFVDAENVELSKDGIKMWRNCNNMFKSLGKGNNEDLSYLMTKPGEAFGSAVGFMESHDEERVAYEQKVAFGGASASVDWGICGTMTSWSDGGKVKDIKLTLDGNLYAVKQLALTAKDQFKIRGNNEWNDAYNCGAHKKDGEIIPFNNPYKLANGNGSKNMAVEKDGKYDIYFHPESRQIWIMNNGQKPVVKDGDNKALAKMMRRGGLNAAFFLTVPGPKMIWQFGEFGYDVSIEEGGRTSSKPLHWEYLEVPERKALHDTYAGLLKFRTENPEFFDMGANFQWYVGRNQFPGKYIFCEASGKRFAVVGNFAGEPKTISVDLPAGGKWYNWFNRNETFDGAHQLIQLQDGDFKLLVNF